MVRTPYADKGRVVSDCILGVPCFNPLAAC